ncbi:2-keto-4-pentenoate hydratase/2-oxohepta-3-ene-1,7-dioic acid hydratase in catechol pathway [Limimaricola soesokkakensis]|uniref:2-keto-4-pentenoate hydratase/2-oxohepta-3-ene-1,7-dioic acid hydratase in catechol pathway n=1 Tax=Limimaricola soesokkakensis TaxID=1343159 RepID=A0A1X6Z2K5_9RHOB|nr:fumarylacetoacetate hydrolase family protein [Limimaricola soesokkakensis]PSK81789.1 2-keto-4-pentenoate hydratase/2-oxohepta-3-ene-1,7-dioic acid hydratase in catechol pathway [Limimaricola soesokkakensis]SLN38679.1 Ureidoglycolate lyase [Limimaricola soesokkakensis]
MRFLVGVTESGPAVHLVRDARAYNLSERFDGVGEDLAGLIGNPRLLQQIAGAVDLGPGVPVSHVTPSLPVRRPPSIICMGLNYIEHIKEGGYDIPDYPALFMRGPKSIMAAGAPMVLPRCSEKLDYEAELMVIIGQGGRHIAEEEALSHVFGYTVFNDGSIRDYQRKTHQWTPGKNFDDTGAIGPFVVTPDELPEGASGLSIESRVGSEILQRSNTANMIWPVARAIAIISEYTTLQPGDHIAMGTPPGVGHAKTPPRWLRSGETVEIEIEGIGICASPVVDEAEPVRSKSSVAANA